MKYNYLVVIGRLPEEENTALLYEGMTLDEASDKFVEDLYEDSYNTREQVEEWHGVSYYIDFVLTSETPISAQYFN